MVGAFVDLLLAGEKSENRPRNFFNLGTHSYHKENIPHKLHIGGPVILFMTDPRAEKHDQTQKARSSTLEEQWVG